MSGGGGMRRGRLCWPQEFEPCTGAPRAEHRRHPARLDQLAHRVARARARAHARARARARARELAHTSAGCPQHCARARARARACELAHTSAGCPQHCARARARPRPRPSPRQLN